MRLVVVTVLRRGPRRGDLRCPKSFPNATVTERRLGQGRRALGPCARRRGPLLQLAPDGQDQKRTARLTGRPTCRGPAPWVITPTTRGRPVGAGRPPRRRAVRRPPDHHGGPAPRRGGRPGLHVPLMSALVSWGLLDLPAERLPPPSPPGPARRDPHGQAATQAVAPDTSANHRALRIELQELHASLGRLIRTIDDPTRSEALPRPRPHRHARDPASTARCRPLGRGGRRDPDARLAPRLFAEASRPPGWTAEDVTIDHDTQAERGWLAVHVGHGRRAPDRGDDGGRLERASTA